MDCIEACPEKVLPSLPELCPESRITKPLCTTAGSFCCCAESPFRLALAPAFSAALSSAQQETQRRISNEGTGDDRFVPDECISHHLNNTMQSQVHPATCRESRGKRQTSLLGCFPLCGPLTAVVVAHCVLCCKMLLRQEASSELSAGPRPYTCIISIILGAWGKLDIGWRLSN